MKLFISFIFVVLSITALKAQSLKGSITDSVSGETIPTAFVVVKLQDSVITQVFSDSDGSYAVDTITPGKYDIEVYFAGYIGKKTNDITICQTQTTELNCVLIKDQSIENVVLEVEQLDLPIIDPFKTSCFPKPVSEKTTVITKACFPVVVSNHKLDLFGTYIGNKTAFELLHFSENRVSIQR